MSQISHLKCLALEWTAWWLTRSFLLLKTYSNKNVVKLGAFTHNWNFNLFTHFTFEFRLWVNGLMCHKVFPPFKGLKWKERNSYLKVNFCFVSIRKKNNKKNSCLWTYFTFKFWLRLHDLVAYKIFPPLINLKKGIV